MALDVRWGQHVWQGIDTTISRTVIVLGSGVGSAKVHKAHLASDWEANTEPFSRFGITVPAIEGHEGSITFTTWDGEPVALLNGRAHLYQAIAKGDFHSLRHLAALIAKAAGPKGRVVFSNTCGGLTDDVPEGSIALPTGIFSLFQSSLGAYYMQGWADEFVSPDSVLPKPESKFHQVVKDAATNARWC